MQHEPRSTPTRSTDRDPLVGGGEMGALMRAFDWTRTPLGHQRDWPASLKTTVGLLLNSRFPMLLWWGPELRQLYNDGYRPILGRKHPAALGARAEEVWSEIWNVFGPMAHSVQSGAPATWNEHLLLLMDRRGYIEETYFTFSYSPVPGDQGEVAGVLVTVQETTGQVQAERQLRMLRDLAGQSAQASTAEEACRAASLILSANDADIPFSAIYLLDRGHSERRLVSTSGFDPRHEGLSSRHATLLESVSSSWPFEEAERTGREVLVDDLLTRFGSFPTGRWENPPARGVVLPLIRSGQARPYGFLVAGISPRREFDERYLGLFRLTADQVSSAIANARAYEEERRRAEALAQLDRAKTAFFSHISHEFRTPLSLILGPVMDTMASPGASLAGRDLESVHRNALRLLKLVNALLDFSRIEAGRVSVAYSPVDLSRLTADLAGNFRSAIERAGLQLVVDCPPMPEPVFVDEEMWERVVLNLVSNAFKHTFEGTIRVALAWAGDHVELTVSDTGVGIPAEELPRVFDRFYRVPGTRARTHEGSGIGLALVSELVRLHGGELSAASEPGRGTTFTVSLPAGSAHVPTEALGANRKRPAASLALPYVQEALGLLPDRSVQDGDGSYRQEASVGRILVVDDNADMRAYVTRLLGGRWEVEAAGNGMDALDAARRRRPDVVITDVMMPGLDGFELMRALRADPLTRDVPVIMLSARAGEESLVEGLEAGADDYLIKPFSARELLARVETQVLRTRLRMIEEAQNKRLTSVFMQVPFAVAILRGPSHVYEFANPQYLELVPHRVVHGKPVVEALPELAEHGIMDLLDNVYQSGQPFVGRSVRVLLNRDPSGPPVECFYDLVFQPMLGHDDTVEGIAVVAFEVTDLTRARRDAEAGSRAKDEFLAMLGHELRNPLAPILTALQLMRQRGIEGAERERVVIERQVEHLVGLVDDLLDVSRITRGKVVLRRQPMELAEAVGKAIEMASPLFEQRKHELRVRLPDQGLRIDGDLDRLAQVIANLLTNAAKYTEPGGRITVSAEASGSNVVLKVRDTGIGIDPDMLPRIFDLFTQERQALDRSQGGLGLGLAIVRSIVTIHGGTVGVFSKGQGRGSEFVITLPRIEAEVPIASVDAGPGGAAVSSERALRVLIVDDNEDAAMMLAELLRTAGHVSRTAHDGPAALTIAAQFKPHVGLLDIGLPVMDGFEVARRFREDPALSTTRLVAVTGYGQEHDRRRSRDAGFAAHLVKPVDLDELLEVVVDLGREATEGTEGTERASTRRH